MEKYKLNRNGLTLETTQYVTIDKNNLSINFHESITSAYDYLELNNRASLFTSEEFLDMCDEELQFKDYANTIPLIIAIILILTPIVLLWIYFYVINNI